jgi:hypothetical protein
MPRFYFHIRSEGQLAEDEHGRLCANNRAAIKGTPLLLGKFLQPTNTFVSTQISDDQHRTIGVIRGKVSGLSPLCRDGYRASAGNDAEAVVLDLVQPLAAGRNNRQIAQTRSPRGK